MQAKALQQIIAELTQYAAKVQESEVQAAVNAIAQANHVFVAGAGRSGFAARGFANRLMHLGFRASFVGEPTTPPIGIGDLLIVGSGSGSTESLVCVTKAAKQHGAKILTITIHPNGTIGALADDHIVLPGTTRQLDADQNSCVGTVQPIGSLFEQLSWLAYDSIVMELREKTHQSREDLIARHGNLE